MNYVNSMLQIKRADYTKGQQKKNVNGLFGINGSIVSEVSRKYSTLLKNFFN